MTGGTGGSGGGCCFNVCSLLSDVRETVSDVPREPDELKKLLMENLGLSKPTAQDASGVVVGVGAAGAVCAFKAPISYTDPSKLHELPTSIIEDLEMIQSKQSSTTPTKPEEGSDGGCSRKRPISLRVFTQIGIRNGTPPYLE